MSPWVRKRLLKHDTESTRGKRNTHQLYIIKIKNFRAANNTIKEVNRQPTEWEKTVANRKSEKGLVSRKYEGLL